MSITWIDSNTTGGTLRATFEASGPSIGRPVTVVADDIETGDRHEIRGWAGTPAATRNIVIDHEIPLNRPFDLRVLDTATGDVLAQIRGLALGSEVPMISHPITGRSIPVSIADWPDFAHERVGSVLHVPGSRVPLIVDGLEYLPTSSVRILHNINPSSAAELEALIESQSMMRIRPACSDLPAVWASARGRTRARFSSRSGSAWVDTIELAHAGKPDPAQLALGSTLGDLHRAVPTLLRDIHLRWSGTLFDIAAEDLTT